MNIAGAIEQFTLHLRANGCSVHTERVSAPVQGGVWRQLTTRVWVILLPPSSSEPHRPSSDVFPR